jgi:hypothetical protein
VRRTTSQEIDSPTPEILKCPVLELVQASYLLVSHGAKTDSAQPRHVATSAADAAARGVRYPGRRTFLQLVTDPEYLKVMPCKLASLEVVITPLLGELVIPGPRWITCAIGAICAERQCSDCPAVGSASRDRVRRQQVSAPDEDEILMR